MLPIIRIITSAITIICVATAANAAQFSYTYDFKINNLHYKILDDNKSVEIQPGPKSSVKVGGIYTETQIDNSAISGDLVIPASVTYQGSEYTVTGLAPYSFQNASISSVTFEGPCNITHIGDRAFEKTVLTEITIPESVNSLGEGCLRVTGTLISAVIRSELDNLDLSIFPISSSYVTMTDLTLLASNPPVLSYGNMPQSVQTKYQNQLTIHIPTGSSQEYKAAWGSEWNFQESAAQNDTFTLDDITLSTGSNADITLLKNGEPTDATQYIWTSSDHDVAYVSKSAHIFAHHPGNAEITCSTPSGQTLASAQISVTENTNEQIPLHVESDYEGLPIRFTLASTIGQSHTLHVEQNDGWTITSASLNNNPLPISNIQDSQVITTPPLNQESTLNLTYQKNLITSIGKTTDFPTPISVIHSYGHIDIIASSPISNLSIVSSDGTVILRQKTFAGTTSIPNIHTPVIITYTDSCGKSRSSKIL